MKTIDLALSYFDRLTAEKRDFMAGNATEEEINQILYDLVVEMAKKMEESLSHREAAPNNLEIAIELNRWNMVWNHLKELLAKHFKADLLQADGFKNFWFKKLPELKVPDSILSKIAIGLIKKEEENNDNGSAVF